MKLVQNLVILILLSKQLQINDINIPLYYKFGMVPTQEHLSISTNKLMTLENWMHISTELDQVLAGEPGASKKSKTFEADSGRLSVKAKWVKISDSDDVGTHIVKILNLSSSSVGKYFLKIDVKLSSYLERMAMEWEQKTKVSERKDKDSGQETTQSSSSKSHSTNSSTKSQDVAKSSRTRSSTRSASAKNSNHRKISDMLPKIEKEKVTSPSMFDDSANAIDDLIAGDPTKVEEYIPSGLQASTPLIYTPEKSSCSQHDVTAIHSEYQPTPIKIKGSDSESYELPTVDTSPTYNPEKKLSEIAMNKIKSEYSPSYLNDQVQNEDVVYKPSTKGSTETEKSKKVHWKNKELFGSSDDSDADAAEKITRSSRKSKRKLASSSKRDEKSSREKSKRKKDENVYTLEDSMENVVARCGLTLK